MEAVFYGSSHNPLHAHTSKLPESLHSTDTPSTSHQEPIKMAISDLMPGLAVNIKVNGQILKEYNDSDLAAEDRTVTRYIEAVSGDIFEIGLQVEKGFRFFGDALSFDVHVDGSDKVDGPLIRREKCIGGEHTRISKGCRLPDDQVKLYQFASVKTGMFIA